MDDRISCVAHDRLQEGDKKALRSFVNAMYRKLRGSAWKRHWSTLDNNELFRLLVHEVRELRRALDDDSGVIAECADVANFAMMIADNFKRMQKAEEVHHEPAH
jgi:NTP pyrophosphatase (non-canonical NTP hydrolase)